jgi:mannose-6-phosphate isomerase-like protein (cupin superfamily)
MNNIFFENLEKITKENNNFRKVISTNSHLQLVLMSLKSGEDIGLEIHNNLDQFFRVEAGLGLAIINDKQYILKNGTVVIIPAGSKHNIINTGNDSLKLYTIYTLPNNPANKIDFEKPSEYNKQSRRYILKLKKYI